MLHLKQSSSNKQINMSKVSSTSCDNLVQKNSQKIKTDKSHLNNVNKFNQHSSGVNLNRSQSITPTSLSYQKSLLKRSIQANKFKKPQIENNDNRFYFSKFQQEFIRNRFNVSSKLSNDDPYGYLFHDKESEEALSQFKKKLESSNLTLVPASDLINNNNNNNVEKKPFVNKYCIVSRHGTIRGTLNHVKDSIKILFKTPRVTNPVLNVSLNTSNYNLMSKSKESSRNQSTSTTTTITSTKENQKLNDKYISLYNLLARDYEKEENQKIVIYTTSLQVVRLAYDKCKRVKKILESHCVKYEERDLYKKKEYQQELKFRLNLNQVDLPHIFFNGKHIGNCDQIESFSDQGLLRKLFKDLEKIKLKIFCEKCAGYRFILCTLCNGGKKKYNNFANLKCTHCNEDGLIRCDFCVEQQLI